MLESEFQIGNFGQEGMFTFWKVPVACYVDRAGLIVVCCSEA